MNTKDIIIFGKTSILAQNFVKNLKNSKTNLIYITRKQTSKNDILCNLGENLTKYEINETVSKIVENTQYQDKIAILFAWYGGPRNKDNISDSSLKNINIVKNFINICKKINPSQIIFISSAGAIYPQNINYNFKEIDITAPSNKYGEEKLKGELLLKNFADDLKFNLIILRVSSAYGYDPRFSDQGVINKWIYSIKNNKKIQLYNSQSSLINFISFDQISEAILLSIEKKLYGIFNIGTHRSITLHEIIEQIRLVTKKKIDYVMINNYQRNFNINVDKFHKKTGRIFRLNVINDIDRIYRLIMKN